jgi:four helix bundle protein
MEVKSYRDLIVWKKSMRLAFDIYNLVKQLPSEERYALADQMRRAVVSIPSNIAEGKQRGSLNDYKRFAFIAKGSLSELETQILLCEGFGYITKEQSEIIMDQCAEISKMLGSLIKKLSTGGNNQV